MTENKIIIRLIVINVIIVSVLYGEISLLQEKLSNMVEMVHTLDDKISRIGVVKEETFINDEIIDDDVILHCVAIVVTFSGLFYTQELLYLDYLDYLEQLDLDDYLDQF